MASIISMLVLSFFMSIRSNGWFLITYSIFLLLSKELRLILNEYVYPTDGKYFFEYYGCIQVIMIALSTAFLSGWYQTLSILSFVLFGIYNYLIFYYWSSVSLNYYDYIALGVIYFNIFIVTYNEKSIIRNITMCLIVVLATIGQERFI